MAPGTEGFIGKRLTEAREARGYSITALVERLGDVVSVSAVSQYERGESTPRLEIAELIAQKLEVPFSFFFQTRENLNEGLVFWRSLSSASKISRTKVKRRLVWLQDISSYLHQYLEFPPLNLPTPSAIGVPADPTQLTKQQIEIIAQKCREFWGIPSGPIDNMIAILEKNGIIVSRSRLTELKLDAFSQFADTNQVPYVFLSNDKESSVRSRLDSGHELAHLIMHKHLSEESFRDKEMHKKLESDAFYFGSAFLMPAEDFSRDFAYPTLNSFLFLKRRWHVSIGAMIMRAKELGLITDTQSSRLWINYSRRGWKQAEPLDDTIRPERPQLLAKSFRILLEEEIRSPDQIVRDLSLNPADIEELSGLPSGFLSNASDHLKIKPRYE
jgi:Zn-dependent peptidase ImmA (M78 family)/transcriptional regulator with XRE-family HTH domain